MSLLSDWNAEKQLLVIAGPCMAESKMLLEEVCGTMMEMSQAMGIRYLFKASFDKANRSSVEGSRGPGLDKGLEWLSGVKQTYGVDILTDVHTPSMIEDVAKVVDVLQIPAFLARQTDMYVEVAKTGKPLNIKKGQFMSPYEMKGAADKFFKHGGKEVLITERGTTFGYGNLVVDFRSVQIIRQMGLKYVYDATHSLQLPAAHGSHSGGQRQFVESLIRAQLAAGADGLFIETHPSPSSAQSDSQTQYPLSEMRFLLEQSVELHHFIRSKRFV